MTRLVLLIACLLTIAVDGVSQWREQESASTVNLRGVHAVSESIAWASGSNGTVLRTLDGGNHWQQCAMPPAAESLDFRGVWAWNANNALVMSSGPGEQSRVYATSDGCSHWEEVARNSEMEGFWDAIVFPSHNFGPPTEQPAGILIGDPVHGRFETLVMPAGHGPYRDKDSCTARSDESAFAASNSSLFVFGSRKYILGTGGKGGPRMLLSPTLVHRDGTKGCVEVAVPMAGGTETSGIFSVFFRDSKHGVAVGGDYKMPDNANGTAAWTDDGGRHWRAATIQPHGYRSAVAWDSASRRWIAVGTNGSDISWDDGKSWHRLSDDSWNAISLPYVVGPKGRIGKLEPRSVRR